MIDLHMHTTHSDGSDSVEELLTKAEKLKISLISITDHDSIDGYKELKDKNIRNIFKGKMITGVELKTFYKGIPMEVLGYGIDIDKLNIHQVDTYEIQKESMKQLKETGKKIGLTFDETIDVSKTISTKKYASFVFATEILKYKENIDILLNYGPLFDTTTFYRVHSSNKESIFYFDESTFGEPLEITINKIHEAGGIAFLAHPLMYPLKDKFNDIEEILINSNLDGLECIYPVFSKEETSKLIELCKKHNKYISGGSDYHAKNKPNIELGTGIDNNLNINEEIISNWINHIPKI